MGAIVTKADAARPPIPQDTTATGIPQSERAAAAAYIADFAVTLAALARGHGFDALGYLLDLARLEAQGLAHKSEPRPSQ
jgi:hypothetical protein